MRAIKRLAGIYLVGLGAIVAVHFITTQFYDPTWAGDSIAVWKVLDPLMAIGIVIVLITAFQGKCSAGRQSNGADVSRQYLEANFNYYFGIVLFIGLLWNWIGVGFIEPTNDNLLLWLVIDTTLPPFVGAAGIRLLRSI